MLPQETRESRHEDDLPNSLRRLWLYPVPVPIELRAHPHDVRAEVDVLPGEAEQLAEPRAREDRGRDQRAVGRARGVEESPDLLGAENPHLPPADARPLAPLQAFDRVGGDQAPAGGVAEDATEGVSTPLIVQAASPHGHPRRFTKP